MFVLFTLTEYGSLKPENFAGARDMDTAIFDVRNYSIFLCFYCLSFFFNLFCIVVLFFILLYCVI